MVYLRMLGTVGSTSCGYVVLPTMAMTANRLDLNLLNIVALLQSHNMMS